MQGEHGNLQIRTAVNGFDRFQLGSPKVLGLLLQNAIVSFLAFRPHPALRNSSCEGERVSDSCWLGTSHGALP